MADNGLPANQIDQDFHDRQRVHAACTCGRALRGLVPVPEAQAWHNAHRAEHHPDRPDQETFKRTHRRKHKKSINTRALTHGYRRDEQTADELDRRETLRYRPGVAG